MNDGARQQLALMLDQTVWTHGLVLLEYKLGKSGIDIPQSNVMPTYDTRVSTRQLIECGLIEFHESL